MPINWKQGVKRNPLGLTVANLTRVRRGMESSLASLGADFKLPAGLDGKGGLQAQIEAGLAALRGQFGEAGAPTGPARLAETAAFGANPGELRMLSYIPPGLPPGAPLVVVLHGCRQEAEGYDRGSAWSALADRHGFALLYPEQRRANNSMTCFNWFGAGDTARGQGEVASIRQMVAFLIDRHGLDPARVFATGLSAGGAMTAALLACYPEVFAGGAIVAGLAYGIASGMPEALECMAQGSRLSDAALADRVRAAAPATSRWPTVSIWQGDADHVVTPANATSLARQWTRLHGLEGVGTPGPGPSNSRRETWRDTAGRVVVEQITISGMGHGLPIDPTNRSGDGKLGEAAPFILDAGVCSSLAIARGWGIAR